MNSSNVVSKEVHFWCWKFKILHAGTEWLGTMIYTSLIKIKWTVQKLWAKNSIFYVRDSNFCMQVQNDWEQRYIQVWSNLDEWFQKLSAKKTFLTSEIQNFACRCSMTQSKDIYKFVQNLMNSSKVTKKKLCFDVRNSTFCMQVENDSEQWDKKSVKGFMIDVPLVQWVINNSFSVISRKHFQN